MTEIIEPGVKYIKFINGDEVLTSVMEDDDYLSLVFPIQIITVSHYNSATRVVETHKNFIQYLQFSEDHIAPVGYEDIFIITDVQQEYAKLYTEFCKKMNTNTNRLH
jgi:hypothetical protein